MRQIHVVIAPGSMDWWLMNLSFLLCGVLLFRASYHKTWGEKKELLAKFIAIVMACDIIVHHSYYASIGDWNFRNNLPLQLCAMSEICSVLLLVFRKQIFYELLIFWSAGAIHAFITPEMTHGYGIYEKTSYVISHGGVVLTAFFATWALGYTPRKWSWFRVFLITQLTLPIIGGINYLVNANYMYLSERPAANNPMIIGEWPWYIVSLELVVLVHFFVFYQLHVWVAARRDARLVSSYLLVIGYWLFEIECDSVAQTLI